SVSACADPNMAYDESVSVRTAPNLENVTVPVLSASKRGGECVPQPGCVEGSALPSCRPNNRWLGSHRSTARVLQRLPAARNRPPALDREDQRPQPSSPPRPLSPQHGRGRFIVGTRTWTSPGSIWHWRVNVFLTRRMSCSTARGCTECP